MVLREGYSNDALGVLFLWLWLPFLKKFWPDIFSVCVGLPRKDVASEIFFNALMFGSTFITRDRRELSKFLQIETLEKEKKADDVQGRTTFLKQHPILSTPWNKYLP
jgi:hypothetical protein